MKTYELNEKMYMDLANIYETIADTPITTNEHIRILSLSKFTAGKIVSSVNKKIADFKALGRKHREA